MKKSDCHVNLNQLYGIVNKQFQQYKHIDSAASLQRYINLSRAPSVEKETNGKTTCTEENNTKEQCNQQKENTDTVTNKMLNAKK